MQRLLSNLRKGTPKSPDVSSKTQVSDGYVKEKVDDYEKMTQKNMDFSDMPPKEELDKLFEEFLVDFLGDAPGNERDMKERMMRNQSDQSKWKIIKMNSTMKVTILSLLLKILVAEHNLTSLIIG